MVLTYYQKGMQKIEWCWCDIVSPLGQSICLSVINITVIYRYHYISGFPLQGGGIPPVSRAPPQNL